MPTSPSPRARLDELFARVDAFFARVHAQHGADMACRAGCSDCCRRRFSVTGIEAAAIREALAALPAPTRATLAARAVSGDPSTCPALDAGGRCDLYGARPLICRTHGLPIRFTPLAPPGGHALPVLDTCPKNFAGQDLGALPAGSVLDQTTLSTVLGALDAAYADELGTPRGERVEIAALLAGADSGVD